MFNKTPELVDTVKGSFEINSTIKSPLVIVPLFEEKPYQLEIKVLSG